MTFGWGERELGKEVAFTFMFLFVAILSKPILCLSVACFLDLFVKLLVFLKS